jgi:predicted RNase H-like HicB family nuclease
MVTAHYSMVIEWSDEDQAYLVSFPEWAKYVAQPVTHGDTYEQAAHKGKEAPETLLRARKSRVCRFLHQDASRHLIASLPAPVRLCHGGSKRSIRCRMGCTGTSVRALRSMGRHRKDGAAEWPIWSLTTTSAMTSWRSPNRSAPGARRHPAGRVACVRDFERAEKLPTIVG